MVKPECRPYQPIEDCFNKGYMQEEAFWNTTLNAKCDKLGEQIAVDYDWGYSLQSLINKFKNICSKPELKAYIAEMRNIRKAQGEVEKTVNSKKLKITLPWQKQAKV